MTPEERIAQAQANHAALELAYYFWASISKAEFDALHALIWTSLAQDLNDMGYLPPDIPPQHLWDSAHSAIDKLNVLASLLGINTIAHPLPPHYD